MSNRYKLVPGFSGRFEKDTSPVAGGVKTRVTWAHIIGCLKAEDKVHDDEVVTNIEVDETGIYITLETL